MATKAHHIEVPEAITDLLGLVDVLRNWEEKGKPCVTQLTDAIEDYNRRIDAVGKIEDIDRLKAQAEAKLAEAVQKLANANVQAAATLEEATALAASKQREIENAMAIFEQLKKDADAAAEQRRIAQDQKDGELRQRDIDLKQAEDRMQHERAQLRNEQAEFDAQARKLREALPA